MRPDNCCPTSDELEVSYYASRLVLQGEGHRADRTNGQDHAVVLRSPAGIVLAVADGVSRCRDEGGAFVSSRCEVGAWIAAEVAAATALEALDAGVEIDRLMGPVGLALAATLGPIWARLGRQAKQGLCSTLLVGVVTPHDARIWASGDGAWGVVLPPKPDTRGSVICHHLSHVGRAAGGAGYVFAGGHEARGFARTATTEARVSAAAVEQELELVLRCDGPVLALHVATDGIFDEMPGRSQLAWAPLRSKSDLEGQLQRDPSCDDLAVAWVASRFPGLFGEEEVSDG